MSALDEAEDVCLGDTTILARAWHCVNINAFLLGEVSNSWSRQGFTSKSIGELLITWRCSRGLIFDLVLRGHNVLSRLRYLHRGGWLCCINFVFATLFTSLINLEHDMADGNDLIVAKVDLEDLACCS